MKRAVLVSERGQTDFAALDNRLRGRIRAALNRVAAGKTADVKKLKGARGQPDLYRLRVGEHRVIFALTPDEVRVTRIIRGSEGYDWL